MLMSKRTLATLVGGMTLALCLTACGNRMPANAPIDEEAGAEKPAPTTPTSEPTPAAPVTPTVPNNPGYTQPVVGSLVVSSVEKVKHGLIFKTLEVKGSVVNTSNVPLSGTLKIEFKNNKGIFSKSLVITETKTQVVARLAPGQTFPFTVTSDKTGPDEAEVTVETLPVAPPAAAAAYPAAGAPYGAPVATGYPAAAHY